MSSLLWQDCKEKVWILRKKFLNDNDVGFSIFFLPIYE